MQLLTRLVALGEVPTHAVHGVYRLLGEQCPRLRLAAAELAEKIVNEPAQGQQVGCQAVCLS